jgi:hypothetical protein
MLDLTDPRGNGRKAVKESVDPAVWDKNEKFSKRLEAMLAKHPISTHPLKEFFENETLNEEKQLKIHLEFGVGFAQIFTDAVLEAMAKSRQLEATLGPAAKVSARFLWAINLMDEIGYVPGENGDQYKGHPFGAHYYQYVETFEKLNGDMKDILTFDASAESIASRKTFTDYYDNYPYLVSVLALSESIFDNFAGSWADNVDRSTSVDTSSGYHTIHVQDEHGDSIDDDHSEDGWTLFRQAVTPEMHEDSEVKVNEWIDTWYKFADKILEIAME